MILFFSSIILLSIEVEYLSKSFSKDRYFTSQATHFTLFIIDCYKVNASTKSNDLTQMPWLKYQSQKTVVLEHAFGKSMASAHSASWTE